MSDFGIFESIASDESQRRTASRKALLVSESRVDDTLGKFLRAAKNADEFDARYSYVAGEFKGIVQVACDEFGYDNPVAIVKSLHAHYRPAESSSRMASMHEARRPKMCPYHSEVVDISLSSGEPRAGYESMAQHAWGDNHCQGAWEGKCGFKREMVTQSFWDDRQKALDERKEQQQELPLEAPVNTEPTETSDIPLDTVDTDLESADSLEPMGEADVAVEPAMDVAVEASVREANQYVKQEGDKWVVVNKEGKVISHHDSKEKAEASFRAIEMGKHGSGEGSDHKEFNPSDEKDPTASPRTKYKGDNDPSDQDDGSTSKKVPCPVCGGDGKGPKGDSCSKCAGKGKVSDWGGSALDALESSTKTAEDGNSGLKGPSPEMDKRLWTPKNVRKETLPHEDTVEKDVTEPIKALNDESIGSGHNEPLKEIGADKTEKQTLPTSTNDSDAGFAGGNIKGPHTDTWHDQTGQTSPTSPTSLEAAKKTAWGQAPEDMRGEWTPEQVSGQQPPDAYQARCPHCWGNGCAVCKFTGSPAGSPIHPNAVNPEIYQAAVDDPDKNPLREMLEEQEGFVSQSTIKRVVASRNS